MVAATGIACSRSAPPSARVLIKVWVAVGVQGFPVTARQAAALISWFDAACMLGWRGDPRLAPTAMVYGSSAEGMKTESVRVYSRRKQPGDKLN